MLLDSGQLFSQHWRIVSIVGDTHHCWHAYIGPTMDQPLHTNGLIFCCNRSNVGSTTTQHRYFKGSWANYIWRNINLPACCLVSQPVTQEREFTRLGPCKFCCYPSVGPTTTHQWWPKTCLPTVIELSSWTSELIWLCKIM